MNWTNGMQKNNFFDQWIARIKEKEKEELMELGEEFNEEDTSFYEKWGKTDTEITLTKEDMMRYYGVNSEEDIDRID